MLNKVGIIINANAKKNRKMRKDAASLYREIGGNHVDVRFTRSLEELEDVLHDFKVKGISILGVSGGDGSLHHAMTRAIKIYGADYLPPLLILKGGTMDNVSRSIHLQGKGPAILQRLVTAMNSGRQVTWQTRNTMKIHDSYCFLFGTGFVANFLNEVYSGKEKGMVRNLQVIYRAVREIVLKPQGPSIFDGIEGEFTADGRKLELDYSSAILAGTVEHVGMGFSPLARALEEANSYHAIVSGIPPTAFLRNLHRIRGGRHVDDPRHHNILVKQLLIRCRSPFQYTMDGDMYESSGELEVVMGPRVKLVDV